MSIGCVGGNSTSAGSMTTPSGFGDSRRLMVTLLSDETITRRNRARPGILSLSPSFNIQIV